MLSRSHRLTSPADFRTTLRRGRRAGSSTLVLHAFCPRSSVDVPLGTESEGPARVGFIVSRAVGGAVTRNEVRRRLRHLARPVVETAPPGSLLVVRALPAAGGATSAQLGADLLGAAARLDLLPDLAASGTDR